ncbi:MAG: TIGR01777 family protein [Verrucomicrobia bacterium]|nr:TIGR01777 family protein [Verrucomicrobiota bacterium]
MKIVVAGASGLIGRALVAALRGRGDQVIRLMRRAPAASDEAEWDPVAGVVDAAKIDGCDAWVNLAGENIAAGRWTEFRRRRIWNSRTDATRTLVVALDRVTRKPAVLVNASAVGIYSERGDEELTEASAIGHGFLPEVCFAWETHAEGAARRGVRVAMLRFGVVLAAEGGALGKMLPVFRLGLGGRVGSGRQWMSWIGLDDAVAAILRAVDDARLRGPVNVVAPRAVTNVEFTARLAAALRRPAVLPVPAWALRTMFGEMADETILASTRVRPAKLVEAGFVFRDGDLDSALRRALQP